MRAWNVSGKYPIIDGNGVVTHTEIILVSSTNGYATFTERVLGNQMHKSDHELVELARENYFKSEYSDRAMSESVQKIDEIESIVVGAKKFMQDAKQKMEEMQLLQTNLEARLTASETDRNNRFSEMKKQYDIINGAVIEMISDYYDKAEENENVSEVKNDGNVDGSDGTTTNRNTETE